MEEIMNDKWISIDEAAEYLGIKTVTLRSWIRNGKEGFGWNVIRRLESTLIDVFWSKIIHMILKTCQTA